MKNAIDTLLGSEDVCIRYLTRYRVLGEDPQSAEISLLTEQMKTSERVRKLLSEQDPSGRIPGSVYAKFTGAHWVLSALAELGYPPGDEKLLPLRDQVYETWLSPQHITEYILQREASSYKSRGGVPIIQGRARRCASQEGNALWSTLALGIADHRADQLAGNLIRWQWPDGGWNCDRKAEAFHSSFMESLIPLRALALHARLRGDSASLEAATHAAEIFL